MSGMPTKTLDRSPPGAARSSLYGLLICFFAVLPAQSQEAHPDSVAFATKHYPALQIPQLLWTGLVYPLGEFTIYSERTELPTRVNDWFTNETGGLTMGRVGRDADPYPTSTPCTSNTSLRKFCPMIS